MGSIPSTLPVGLVRLNIYGNKMSGNIPSFPPTLQYLWLGYPGESGNHFTGSLRLNQPLRLYINNNGITDVILQDSSQIDSRYCDLSNNPLLGNPNIAALTMCAQNGLYSAESLPVTTNTFKIVTVTAEEILSPIRVPTATNYFSTLESFNNLYTTTITTITFQIQIAELSITLSKLIRFTLSAVFLLILIRKTPFVREFKKKLKIEQRSEL